MCTRAYVCSCMCVRVHVCACASVPLCLCACSWKCWLWPRWDLCAHLSVVGQLCQLLARVSTPHCSEIPGLWAVAATLTEGEVSQAQSPDGTHLFASWYTLHPGLCQKARKNTANLCLQMGLLVHSPQATVTSTGQQHFVPGPAWSGVFSLYDSCCCC